jgi:hypothetical protein
MAEKLIINADMVCKADRFSPQKYEVEKVIEVSESEFRAFAEKAVQRNYYFPMYKDLMGFYDGSYHGILFVNKENGDGILVNSEGGNYARYSQYIPHAKYIVQKHEQSLALDDLKIHMDCCIDRWLDQHKNETDMCVSLTEFINDSALADILADYVSESLSRHPQIESCTIGNGFIEATKSDLVKTKLYCPLTIRIEPEEDDYGDLEEVDSSNYIYYDDEINRKIRESLNYDDDEREHGLNAYTHSEHLAKKVYSVFPSVETRGGDLYGVFTVKSYGELDKAELIELTDEAVGQASDGFGECLEQHAMEVGGDEIYISFWNCDDGCFMKPENEVFPEHEITQTMGGM